MTADILDIRNLVAGFGSGAQRKVVLNGVCLKVQEKSVTAIIGPSGCGKSTFIRCLNRLHQDLPDSFVQGEAFLQVPGYPKRDLLENRIDSVKVRRQVGMVFQKPNPFPSFTVYENVALGLRLVGVRKKAVLDERVELSLRAAALWDEVKDSLNRPSTALSGGQQQRLCIARALAVEPDVLLMDEPTSALDPISSARIEELISELKKRVTILIVTHNMQQAARVSDRTAFLYLGDLIEEGLTVDLFTRPKDKRTEQYVTGRFG